MFKVRVKKFGHNYFLSLRFRARFFFSSWNSFCFEKTIYHFMVCIWCSAIAAGGLGAAQGPKKPEGSGCSEMHSQPYLSPKWVIPDENSSCFEKIIYLFYHFLVCRAVCLWHTTIAAGGLVAAQGPHMPEGSRCSEMRSQPIWDPFFDVQGHLAGAQFFFSWSQRSIIFLTDYQGSIIFFKEFHGTIIIFNSIHTPPPPLDI